MKESVILLIALSILVDRIISAPPKNYQCPTNEGPGSYVTFLIDEEDCNAFYMCNHGTPAKMFCPATLYFNPKINVSQ